MNRFPQNRMTLGVFLLFWTVCNGLFGTAGFALCLHELGSIHLMEESHELETERCGEGCEPCDLVEETGVQSPDDHCLDIEFEGELGDFVQNAYSLKAMPPMVSDLVSILDAMPRLRHLFEEQDGGGEFDHSALSICQTPILVTESTVFRL